MNEMPLSLNGDTFNALKADFDAILRDTISNMELKGADNAEMSVKLKISLEKDRVSDFEATYEGALRDIIKPKFDHAVQSVLQIKDKKDGTLSGNYELVWDGKAQKYIMREITDGQTSLFDQENKDSSESGNKKVGGPAQIEGKTPGALPPPKEEVIEADFREVDDGQDSSDEPKGEDDKEAGDGWDQEDDYSYDDPDQEGDNDD